MSGSGWRLRSVHKNGFRSIVIISSGDHDRVGRGGIVVGR
jgi:hypothetical protein